MDSLTSPSSLFQGLISIAFLMYAIAIVGLFIYGLNCYWLLGVFLKKKRRETLYDKKVIQHFYKHHSLEFLPHVTTQLPVYNEANVVERIIHSVCAMEYPMDKQRNSGAR